jgi:D-3-phosphoglycerate dehydrogenase
MELAQRLRIVGVSRGGALNINLQAATERGIPVVNAPGRNAQAAVEYTLGMMLAESRGIARAHTVLREGVWEGKLTRYELAGRELQGQTIGLVGFGASAQALVPYLHPFGVKLLAYDPYIDPDRFAQLNVSGVDLDTLLRESDIVSIHARVTPQTRGLIGARELALMKPTARLINTARGPLLDYNALYEALRDGRIGGAALDTFAEEPPPADWPLLRLPNVTLTPHLAGNTRESAERGAQMVAEDVANFLARRPLLHCMNGRELGIA